MTDIAPRFALPGTWGRVNLASDATIQKSIRKVVEHAVGRDDKLATLRSELRGRFREAADLARDNSAVDFYLALELAPGVPLPAWLAVFLPDLASTDIDKLGLGELRAALNVSVSATAPQESANTSTIALNRVQAVRQVFRRVQAATEESPEIQLLQADYWLAASNPNRIALLTFTTTYADLEQQMLEFFDAVIGTVRWDSLEGAIA
ncbi:MAG: hypothetical protein JWO10_2143 [Microbacteriaceae bacterium]|nr:hypothetical protein [Microbacteriaceae bacterium]